MRAAAFVMILGVASCGPELATSDPESDTGDTGDTGDTMPASPTSEGGDTADATTGTACLEVDYPKQRPGDDLGWELGCGFPELCPGDEPLVFLIEYDRGVPTSVETKDLERGRCMAAALRDRQLGQFAFMPVDQGGQVISRSSLEIVGEQAIARAEPGWCELLGPCETHEALRLLQPPAFFSACVDGDAKALFLCLSGSVLAEPACLPGPLPCR